MDPSINIFPTPLGLAEEFARELVTRIKDSAGKRKQYTIALSGGSTPELLFSLLGSLYAKVVPWNFVELFWGDERCVPPDNSESNYGMTKRALIDKIDIPIANIHRIRGEDEPENEAKRYSEDISFNTAQRLGLPVFDLVILGLGEDGHTASIFPGHSELFKSDKICEVTYHPINRQKRVTITGRVINNADAVSFLVTGKKKSAIVEEIIKKSQSALNFPAAHVVPVTGSISWFLDSDAASLL